MTALQTACYAHYLGKGIRPIAAAGIVGVLDYESKLNPLAENNTGTDTGGAINPHGAFGLAQWNGPRQAALVNFASGKGLVATALNTQLDFVLTEAANSYPEVWAGIQNPNMSVDEFITLFVEKYEAPKNPAPEIAGALATAKALLAGVQPIPPIGPNDPEIIAIGQLCAILAAFPATAQKRIIGYLSERFG